MRAARIALVVLLAACGTSQKPPDGYIDACYGGDWSEHMVGKSPVYSVVLNVEQEQWPELKALLKTYAGQAQLKHFDTSQETEGLSMLSVSACSQDGLWVHADKRIWRFKDEKDHSPLPLMVTVVVYANPEKWRGVPQELDSALRAAWPGRVDADHGFKSTLKSSLL